MYTGNFPSLTRRPASADSTARRQFQATGQPVSRTQASDAMTSRLSVSVVWLWSANIQQNKKRQDYRRILRNKLHWTWMKQALKAEHSEDAEKVF